MHGGSEREFIWCCFSVFDSQSILVSASPSNEDYDLALTPVITGIAPVGVPPFYRAVRCSILKVVIVVVLFGTF